MKIQYISNTYDVDGLEKYGEIMVFLKDGEPLSSLDTSDAVIDPDYIADLLNPFGIDIEFEEIEPDAKLIRKLKKYLKINHEHYSDTIGL